VVLPVGAVPGSIYDHTGETWRPSGRGITVDLCEAILSAMQLYAAEVSGRRTPLCTDPSHKAQESAYFEVMRVHGILSFLIESWFSSAAGMPGITLADIDRVRDDVLDWRADWFHLMHRDFVKCDRCARYTKQFEKDGVWYQAQVFTGRDPVDRGHVIRNRLLQIRAFVEPDSKNSEPSRPTHSPDFTSVSWFGTRYTFAKGNQAESVRALWEAWMRGGHSLSQETIGESIGSTASRFELAKVFRRKSAGSGYEPHPAWGTMIRPDSKGSYRLTAPESA
jgi:hypothetical protein